MVSKQTNLFYFYVACTGLYALTWKLLCLLGESRKKATDFHYLLSFSEFIEEAVKEIFKHDPFELEKTSCSNGFISFFRLWHSFVVPKAVAKGWAANPKKPRAILENSGLSL